MGSPIKLTGRSPQVETETRRPNIEARSDTRSRSAQEQSSIDDDTAHVLGEADIPPPPRGVIWALSRPPHLTPQAFWARLNSRMDDVCIHIRLPHETRGCIEKVLPDVLEPATKE